MLDQEFSSNTGTFVRTPALQSLIERAQAYLEAGVPVHLRGPAGVGKTTLAMHLAALRGRPISVIYGNEVFRGFELVGKVAGMRRRTLVDNFIHNVEKRMEEVDPLWADGRLLQAIRDGGTLVYDEFTRSRPEANNVLLSVLEEGWVEVPDPRDGPRLIPVHPEFRAIFTSNPEEYAGVHRSQDALEDRLLTLDLLGLDEETEVLIVSTRGAVSEEAARAIVRAVRRRLRKTGKNARLSLRPGLMAARVVHHLGIAVNHDNPEFEQLCDDVVGTRAGTSARSDADRAEVASR